jgi:hypothetical protein
LKPTQVPKADLSPTAIDRGSALQAPGNVRESAPTFTILLTVAGQ